MTGKIKEKIDRVSPGSGRVDRVPGQPGLAEPIPKRVLASTRTGPMLESTRRAGLGFKTLLPLSIIFFVCYIGGAMSDWLDLIFY